MKLLFLSDASSLHTKRWVNYFVDRGYESYLISLEKSQGTKANEFFISPKSEHQFIRYPLAFPALKNLIKRIEPDLVNAHFIPNYGFLGALSKKKPLVVSTWGSDVLISPRKSIFHRLRAKYVLSRADLVTCDGDNLVAELNSLGVMNEKIIHAPMGVEEKVLKQRQDRPEGKEEIIILSFRKLEPVYDLKTLIKAIPLIIDKASKRVKFWVIGEGSQRNELIKLSTDLDIEENIEFKGCITREELENCLQKADIYISTSLSDSTSVSLLEAMASGLVPVVSDIQGNRDWINDGENGFLFPPGDFKALAQRIIWIINKFSQTQRIRERNLKTIKERALWGENMKMIEKKFLELLEK